MPFSNVLGLLGLVSLIPLIILYLIKPRPQDISIPSLMFIAVQMGETRSSFLRRLVRDPLLLLQMLALILLVLALAAPFYWGSRTAEHTVVVLDGSASMQAVDVSPSRFDRAVEIARGYLEGDVSIILAESTPLVMLERGSSRQARGVLARLRAGATPGNLGDAILLAMDLIGREKGRIVVVSDFAGSLGSPEVAERLASAEDIEVVFRQVGVGGDNIGFIDARIVGDKADLVLKNYLKEDKTVEITLSSGGKITRKVAGGTSELVTISGLQDGVTRVKLERDDDLAVDNAVYIAMPQRRQRRVLIISDGVRQNRHTPVYLAVRSLPDSSVKESLFEQAPQSFDYDLVVLDRYTRNSPLPGTFSDLKAYVENGGTLLVMASPDLPDLPELLQLLPVEVRGVGGAASVRITVPVEFAREINFGSLTNYLKASSKNSAVAVASVLNGNDTLIAYWNLGRGRVVYLGVNELWSQFHLSTSYPVFWFKLLDWVSSIGGVEDYNFKTGELLALSDIQEVETPRGTFKTRDLLLEDAGTYKLGDREIAANLLDSEESDLTPSKTSFEDLTGNVEAGSRSEEKDLTWLALLLALVIILYEIVFLKQRGEI